MDCIFCKIIKKELPSKILYEDDLIMVLLDAYPDAPGHTLIITKKHFSSFFDLPDDLLLHVNKYAKIYGKLIEEKLECNALKVITNYGEFQFVKHYHLHLIPNKNNEKLTIDEVYSVLKEEK